MLAAPAFPILAYVDTSAALAIAFGEPGWELTARRLAGFPVLLSSNLLEAEARAAYQHNRQEFDPTAVSEIGWVHPNRSLRPEMERAIAAGSYLKGADLWHIAVALYIDGNTTGATAFITLDERQRALAAILGFET